MSETPQPVPTIDDLLVHADFVRGIARATVRGDDLVEDTVQQTWLEVARQPPRHGHEPKAWLAKVTRHAGWGLLRKRARRDRHEAFAASKKPASVPSTSEIAAKEETRRQLVATILRLDEPYRSAVLLRYYEERPPREVAARLDVPVETARTRIKRGLAKLRGMLDEQHDGDRRAWTAALAPLAGLTTKAAATAVATAGIGAGKLAAVALLVCGVGLGAVWWAGGGGKQAAPAGAGAARDETEPGLEGRAQRAMRGKGEGALVGSVTGRLPPGSLQVAAYRMGAMQVPGEVDGRWVETFQGWLDHAPDGGVLTARAAVSPAGRFVLEGLHGAHYRLELLADGRPVAAGSGAVWTRGMRAKAELSVPDGELVLTGHARYANGEPFRGWVYAKEPARSGMARFTVTSAEGPLAVRTDDEGGFRIEGLHAGKLILSAHRPGSYFAQRRIELKGSETHEFVVPDPDDARDVAVVDEGGNGVPNLRAVAARSRRDVIQLLVALRGSETGTLRLPRGAEGYAAAPGLRQGRISEKRERVTLERAAALRGRVVDAVTRQPVEGAVVRAAHGRRLLPTTAESAADGTYTLGDLPHDECTAFVFGGGFVSKELDLGDGAVDPLAVQIEGNKTQRDLEVVAAGHAVGRVVDARGNAVTGALVVVVPGARSHVSSRLARVMRQMVATDGEGRFRVDTLLPDMAHTITAWTADARRAHVGDTTVASGETADVTITLPAPNRFTVRMTDQATGEPAADVRVMVKTAPARNVLQGLGQTAREGTLHVQGTGLRAGQVADLHWESKQYVDGKQTVTLPEDGGFLELRADPGLSITGRVQLPSTVSTDRVRVEAADPEHKRKGRWNAELDDEGRFRIAGLAPGRYDVRASAGRLRANVAAEAGDSDVLLTLRKKNAANVRPATWRIAVRGENGEVVPGFTLARIQQPSVAYLPRTTRRTGMDGRSGSAAFNAVPAGVKFWLSVHAAAKGKRRLPLGPALLGPFEGGGEDRSFEATLPPERILTGRLLGPDGKGLVGVPVEGVALWPGFATDALDEVHGETRTRADGRFRLGGLGALRYRITFKLPKGLALATNVEAEAGDTDVEARAIRLRSAVVTVTDAAGKPVGGAYVGGRKTDGTGRATLERLRPEEQRDLNVTPPVDRPDLGMRRLEGWAGEDVEVVLPARGVIRGRVRFLGQRPKHVWLQALPSSGTWDRAYWIRQNRTAGSAPVPVGAIAEDGSFVAGGLPEDEYDLTVTSVEMLHPEPVARTRARTGDTNVTVTFDAGRSLRVRILNWSVREPAHVNRARISWLGGERERGRHAQIDAQGRMRFKGLHADKRYRVFVSRPDLGMYFLSDDMRAGEDEVEIRLVEGKSIRGRIVLPAGVRRVERQVSITTDGVYVSGTVDEDGNYEIAGLPDGEWEVHAFAHGLDGQFLGRARVKAGASGDIDMASRPDPRR